tara:strand:+ start:236 stop:580 length:345 start_codon:yes stop_codon:yes gene_type:complete
MKSKIISLSKNIEFKSILNGKKFSNKYSTIFFKKLKDKDIKKLNISFVTKKKIGNAVKRNKIKRRLRNIMNYIVKENKVNLNFSYLVIAKKVILDTDFTKLKEDFLIDFKKINF